ncbi:YajQ family cyclic di-GMP-binding protein [Clostridium formicaceticum]|uniref:Nucleotide-binding protein BJL90_08245 n=1 Tax=Clostridium formicaceticum TaxID=1497 RepID=A0AAC9RL14_9CLOT|nr:YajQ family cyclic di-GMP-binding protein [Clostridium formicaceticum]AOY75884.1 YajQ family cyclic di-GMP-binding protein [Clostridium formicaceticum]ARE86225.1 putative nucleotide-binding protein [Clostridium formicaceticum]
MAAKDSSFDIVSEVDMQEVTNAITQTEKEIAQRFDFKGSNTTVEKNNDEVTIVTSDDFKLRNVVDIFQSKLAKRNVSLKALDYQKPESSLGGRMKQVIKVKQGISQEEAKKITTLIKGLKIKVQASVQGDVVRVSGKNRDDLQAVIQALKAADLPMNLQFTNYR